MKNQFTILFLAAVLLLVVIGCRSKTNITPSNFSSETNTNLSSNSDYSANSNVNSASETSKNSEASRNAWINDKVDELTKLPGASRMTKQPYIKGLAVAYSQDADSEDKTFTPDDSYLPDGTKAYAVDELGTIILVKNKKVKYGDYEVTGRGRLTGYVLTSEVTIVDQTIPAVIFKRTFRGDAPGESVMVSPTATSIEGGSPDSQVMEFLEKLPKRTKDQVKSER